MKTFNSNEQLSSTVDELLNELDQTFRGDAWLEVLQAISIMGVINNQQLITMTSIERDSLGRLLNRMEEASGSNKLFKRFELKVQRGRRGRAPKIYCLTELGAALLRKSGSRDVRAYGETNPIAISHDLCIVDLFQLARKSKLEVKLEERIYFSEKEYLLPDLLLKMENGLPVFIEVEQAVHPNYLRRMVESLRRRLSFFSSDTGKFYSPDIRMLFNLPANGKEVESSIERWKSVLDILSNENGNRLPFRVMAMSIHSFLDSPKWTSDFDDRWIDVVKYSPLQRTYSPITSILPTDLPSYDRTDDQFVLNALSQWFEENSHKQQSKFALPDKHFLEIIQLIYLASHKPNYSALEKAAFPHASLFLLKRYFYLHPELKHLLRRIIDRDWYSTRCSPTTILSKIQCVIDLFLYYHGWNNRDQLIAYTIIGSWNEDGPKDYGIRVKISSSEILLREPEEVAPTEHEIRSIEKMLAWVLWSMITFSKQLGIQEMDSS